MTPDPHAQHTYAGACITKQCNIDTHARLLPSQWHWLHFPTALTGVHLCLQLLLDLLVDNNRKSGCELPLLSPPAEDEVTRSLCAPTEHVLQLSFQATGKLSTLVKQMALGKNNINQILCDLVCKGSVVVHTHLACLPVLAGLVAMLKTMCGKLTT